MAEVNLLVDYPAGKRSSADLQRSMVTTRAVAREFAYDYFDGDRRFGYGGYYYDGRWKPVAAAIVRRFALRPSSRVLDIGCAKGFLLRDIVELVPEIEVHGIDISHYAIEHADPIVRDRIKYGTADKLAFPDGHFDAVLAINVLHNLPADRCMAAIREIERVSGGAAYIQVDAYRDGAERELFLGWALTAITHGEPEMWRRMFDQCGYTGDYYWTFLPKEG